MPWYVPWHNPEHKHSWARREQTQHAYYDAHPERFRRRPSTPLPAGIVGINLPKTDTDSQPERLQAA